MCDHKKIMNKIKNLIDLSESPNENEASVALFKARELLAKYNLEMTQIEGYIEETKEDVKGEILTENRPGVAKWEQYLMGNLAPIFSCRLVRFKRPYSANTFRFKYTLYGFPDDVCVFKYLYEYLMSVMPSIVSGEMKGMTFEKNNDRKRYRESFLLGMTIRILERVKEKFERLEQNEYALVIKRGDKVQSYIDAFVKAGRKSRIGRIENEAFLNGRAKGDEVSLNRGINGASNNGERLSA